MLVYLFVVMNRDVFKETFQKRYLTRQPQQLRFRLICSLSEQNTVLRPVL